MSIENSITVQAALPADWRLLAEITTDAFIDDPVTSWIFGSRTAMASGFRKLARGVYLPRGHCDRIDDLGATQWMPHGGDKSLSTVSQLALVADILRCNGSAGLNRLVQAEEAMALHRPKDPHMYLFTIGVRREARGKGLGHKLLAGMLSQCDRENMPIYLENSKPENHGFYASHGFEQIKIFQPGKDAPPMESMWRVPKSV